MVSLVGMEARDPFLLTSHQQMRGLAAWLLLLPPQREGERGEISDWATLWGMGIVKGVGVG